MPSELELIYVILAVQAVGMLALTAFYYLRRLSIEERRSTALEAQRAELHTYYDNRLSIEKAKLEVEREKLKLRGNGP